MPRVTSQISILLLAALVFYILTARAAPTSVTDGDQTTGAVLATGWYPSWLGDTFPPEQISWSKYTGLTFAFA